MVALRPRLMNTYEDYCMNDIRVKYITHAGTDKLVADVARVSFANTQFDPLNEASEKDVGLINYLARDLKQQNMMLSYLACKKLQIEPK